MDEVKKPLGTMPLWITSIVPFFLPALFFQSAVFAFISPLPLFILSLKNKPLISLAALVVNVALIFAAGIHSEALVVTVFWFATGLFFPFMIRRSGKISVSFLLTLAYLVSMLLLGLVYLSHQEGLGLIEYLRLQLSTGMDHLIALPDSPVKALVDEQGRDALFKQLMTELPSGILMAIILSLWINLLFAAQLVRGFLPPEFWGSFKVPELLVWPTLLFAGLFALTDHAPYYIGLNGLKVLLVFYGFQGLSVASFLLTRYKVFGFGRALIFTLSVFVAMPLVLSLGFFDLWFDFRAKFGQS
jgi:hypothetical protein